jgi:WD40 repeat protein
MWKLLAIAVVGSLLAPAASGQVPASPYAKAGSVSVGHWRGDVGDASLPFALLPTRAKLAYVERSGRLTVIDLKTETRAEFSHPLPVKPTMLVGSPDGTQLILAADVPGSGGQLVKLDIDSGAVLTRMQLPDGAKFGGLVISRATGHVAVLTAEAPRKLMLFDGDKGSLIFSVDAKPASFVTFRPDGQQVVTSGMIAASRQGLIQFWNAQTGVKERQLITRPSSPLVPSGRLAMSPDGSTIVVQQLLPEGVMLQNPAENGASAVLLRVEDGAQVGELKGHAAGFVSVQFSHDGARILTGSIDRTVRVWSGRDGTPVATLEGYPRLSRPIGVRDVVAAQFAPRPLHPIWPYGSDAIISATGDGEYVFWEDSAHTQARLGAELARHLSLAEQGDSNAMSRLFTAYDQGEGVERDVAKADLWLRRLALEPVRSSQLTLATRLVRAAGASQDCSEAGQWVRKAKSTPEPNDGDARSANLITQDLERLRDEALRPIGGIQAAASLAPTIQADLLETQMLDALTKKDHQVFLANLCAFEFLGHADAMPAAARHELLYHRAVALRAERKPLPALTALNAYLAKAGRGGANYSAALQMLRPLQAEANP